MREGVCEPRFEPYRVRATRVCDTIASGTLERFRSLSDSNRQAIQIARRANSPYLGKLMKASDSNRHIGKIL